MPLLESAARGLLCLAMSERCVISTFQVVESLGSKGDFLQWEKLLRIGD